MASMRYVKDQRTIYRNFIEEKLKKVEEILDRSIEEEVKKQQTNITKTMQLINKINTCEKKYKEITENLSNLIDENGIEDEIKAREKEENEEFLFCLKVDDIIEDVLKVMDREQKKVFAVVERLLENKQKIEHVKQIKIEIKMKFQEFWEHNKGHKHDEQNKMNNATNKLNKT